MSTTDRLLCLSRLDNVWHEEFRATSQQLDNIRCRHTNCHKFVSYKNLEKSSLIDTRLKTLLGYQIKLFEKYGQEWLLHTYTLVCWWIESFNGQSTLLIWFDFHSHEARSCVASCQLSLWPCNFFFLLYRKISFLFSLAITLCSPLLSQSQIYTSARRSPSTWHTYTQYSQYLLCSLYQSRPAFAHSILYYMSCCRCCTACH